MRNPSGIWKPGEKRQDSDETCWLNLYKEDRKSGQRYASIKWTHIRSQYCTRTGWRLLLTVVPSVLSFPQRQEPDANHKNSLWINQLFSSPHSLSISPSILIQFHVLSNRLPGVDHRRVVGPVLEHHADVVALLGAQQIAPQHPDLVHLLAVRLHQLVKIHARHIFILRHAQLVHIAQEAAGFPLG